MNKHTSYDLAQMQSLPLESKIMMTERRIREWSDYWDGNVYLAWSGGKDSTVLKHIIDNMGLDVPAVFVNTGLEYPEIQSFVRDVKAGEYDCFNTNIEILRPEMRFDEVIEKYGYPVVSKEVADTIYGARNGGGTGRWKATRLQRLRGEYLDKDGNKSAYNCEKWGFLLDAPFKISDKCCNVMKKKPSNVYSKRTKRKQIVGTMASESRLRYSNWLKNGCNAYEQKKASSQPLSFWTEQDILEYILKYDVPYAKVYGEIRPVGEADGQLYMNGTHPKLELTGVKRTGCMFCMFGCHLEKEPNRFQQMKETHPKQWDYCINKLGLKEVLEYINVPYE